MDSRLVDRIHAWLIGWGWKSYGQNDFEEENEREARAALTKLLLSDEPLPRDLRALLAVLVAGNSGAANGELRPVDRQWLEVFGDRTITVGYVKPGKRPDLMHRRRVVNAIRKRIIHGMSENAAMADAAVALGIEIDAVKRIYLPASKRLPLSSSGVHGVLFK